MTAIFGAEGDAGNPYRALGLPRSQRLLLSACRRSFRLRQRAQAAVSTRYGSREVCIPLIRGLGWDLLHPPVRLGAASDVQIQSIAKKLYAEGRRGCFVDIGANQGRIIVNLQALGFDLSYLGFEPQVSAAAYVQELIRANELSRHNIIAAALGAENTMLTLYTSSDADVTATTTLSAYSKQRYTQTTLVPVLTTDSQLGHLDDDIFVVKIDTEGSEIDVLRGMERTLREKAPPVYFEVMGYRALLEGRYSREFTRGELPTAERKRIIDNRRNNMETMGRFWHERDWQVSLCRADGRLIPVDSLDPGPDSVDNRPEMNFLAVRK